MSGEVVPTEDLPDSHVSGMEVPSNDLSSAGDEVPIHDLPQEAVNPKYSTPMQQLGTMAEGAAQGLAGPVATAAELGLSKLGVPNMTAEDISAREAANPTEHAVSELGGFGAGLFTGASEAGVAAKIAEHFSPEAVSFLGKIGSKAINGAIQAGIFSGANEINKGLLDQGDPSTPAASAIGNVGAASLFGFGVNALLGGAGQVGSKAAEILSKKNIGGKLNDLLTGVGLASASTPEQIESYLAADNPAWAKKGLQLYKALHYKLAGAAAGTALANALPYGNDTATERVLKDVGGMVAGAYLGPKAYNAVGKTLAPVIYKILGSGVPEGAEKSINYAIKAMQGSNKISRGIDSLFDYGTSKAVDYADPGKHIEDIKKYIENGGVDSELPQMSTEQPEGYAGGGEVNPAPVHSQGGIAAHFPAQNVLLNEAKGRISNYLKVQKPVKKDIKYPFETEHNDPNKERQYDHTVRLAAQPLQILNHIKSGNLTPKQVQDFSNMYPELHNHLKQKMMEKIIDKANKKEKPPYKLRQSLSLFMGSDLDASLSQPNIMAAQNVFNTQAIKGQAQAKMAGLSKLAKSSMTPGQGAEERLNKN